MAQNTRLTYEYMDYARQLYRETRMVLRQRLWPLVLSLISDAWRRRGT